MAPWQFRTKVIPKMAPFVIMQQLVHEEDFARRYWAKCQALDKTEDIISGLLPEVPSWSTSARMFGDSKGDQIEIWKDEGKLAWVAMAFSLSHPNIPFIRDAIKSVSNLNSLFLSVQSKELFEPDHEHFVQQALKCSAARYIPNHLNLSASF